MSEQPNWQSSLVHTLIEMSRPGDMDRATLAHLRRGLGETPDRVLAKVGWLFRDIYEDKDVDTAILVAGLFALTKGLVSHCSGINFGHAFGRPRNDSDTKHPKYERRFIALLDTDKSELDTVLRHALVLISKEPDIGLDWIMFMQDIKDWDLEGRIVQRRWARGFWSSRANESEEFTEPQTLTIPN